MRRWRRVALWSVSSLVLALAAAITMTVGWRPFIGPSARPVTDRRFTSTPERLERGRYMFTALNGCVDCHSEKDRSADGHPAVPGTEGSGRVWIEEEAPWLTASNITPDEATGVGDWTDDELARAIREGIGRDGRALFPIMPYTLYRDMSDEDLASVIVYLRTLKPIRKQLPKTRIPFPPGPLINSVPQPVTAPVPAPDMSEPIEARRLSGPHGGMQRMPYTDGRPWRTDRRNGVRRRVPADRRQDPRLELEHHAGSVGHPVLHRGSLRVGDAHGARRRARAARHHAVEHLSQPQRRGPRGHVRVPAHAEASEAHGRQHRPSDTVPGMRRCSTGRETRTGRRRTERSVRRFRPRPHPIPCHDDRSGVAGAARHLRIRPITVVGPVPVAAVGNHQRQLHRPGNVDVQALGGRRPRHHSAVIPLDAVGPHLEHHASRPSSRRRPRRRPSGRRTRR